MRHFTSIIEKLGYESTIEKTNSALVNINKRHFSAYCHHRRPGYHSTIIILTQATTSHLQTPPKAYPHLPILWRYRSIVRPLPSPPSNLVTA